MTYTNILQQLQQYAKEHNVAIITATQLKNSSDWCTNIKSTNPNIIIVDYIDTIHLNQPQKN